MSFQKCKVVGKSISPATYHGHNIARGDLKYPVSSSMLKEFSKCPSRWIRGYESPESASKDFGNLLDTLVLTPELFDTRYAVEPLEYQPEKGDKKPWHNGAGVCEEWKRDQLTAGRIITSETDIAEAKKAVQRISSDEILSAFIFASDRQVLVEGEWKDEASGLVLPVRCLIDLVPRLDTEFSESLGDLKSTRSAAIRKFQNDVFQFGYHIQAAFDLDIFNAATNEGRMAWGFVVQENFAPFEIGRRMMRDAEKGEQPEDSNLIALGRSQYKRMLENYAWCLATKKWTSYDDSDKSSAGWTPVNAEPWMAQRVLFEPKFQQNETEDAPVGDDLRATL